MFFKRFIMTFSLVFFAFFSIFLQGSLSYEIYLRSINKNSIYLKKIKDKNYFTTYKNELLTLVKLLYKEAEENPNRHIISILREVQNKELLPFLKEEIKKLLNIVQTNDPVITFPYENIAYQALILFIRSWPKLDLHCHVSPSLSEQWVTQVMRDNWDLYQGACEQRVYEELWQPWRSMHQGTVTFKAIEGFVLDKSNEEIQDMFKIYENPTDAFDVPITLAPYNNYEVFLNAFGYVTRCYFRDGVRHVVLRFNPCKEFNEKRIDPLVVLEGMAKIALFEEEKANKKYGGKHRISFLFSFNQAKYEGKKSWFMKTIERVVQERNNSQKDFLKRFVGVDLSGMECEKSRRSLWCEIYTILSSNNVPLDFVAHVGDRWNVDEEYNQNLSLHLDYVSDALQVPGISRMGHCNALCSYYKAYRADPECAERIFKTNVKEEEIEKVEEIISLIKEKNIIIECLPKTEFKSVFYMKQNPFYYWKKMGIRLAIGLDGSCYIDGMLSEWILWLLLAAPQKENVFQASVTVQEVKDIVCMKGAYD